MSKGRKIEINELSQYKIEKKLGTLTERDYDALNSIYDFRCLSYEQIYNLIYKINPKTGEINNQNYSKRKLKLFLETELIKEVLIYDKDIPPLYQLTTAGINVLRKYKNWPDNIYDERKRIHSKGYLIESELNVKERFMAHQYNLNKFVLNLEEIFKNQAYKYEDEKHLRSFVGIRPDGVFTLNNAVFFLEMDMGTENDKQLKEKWDHYRTFLSSNEFILRERKIYVLFIVDGIVRINQRISLIKNTINSHFIDCFSQEIELFIDTPDKLIDIINNSIMDYEESDINSYKKILINNNFKIIDDEITLRKIFNTKFSFFSKKEIGKNHLNFVFEDYYYCPMSSVHKAVFFHNISRDFINSTSQDIKLVLICEDEIEAYRVYNIFELKDTLFTTKARLENLKLHEALFSLDNSGAIYCFEDESFTNKENFGQVKI